MGANASKSVVLKIFQRWNRQWERPPSLLPVADLGFDHRVCDAKKIVIYNSVKPYIVRRYIQMTNLRETVIISDNLIYIPQMRHEKRSSDLEQGGGKLRHNTMARPPFSPIKIRLEK